MTTNETEVIKRKYPNFENATIEELNNLSNEELDYLDFGLIKADNVGGKVEHYNKRESEFAQIHPEKVRGKIFCVDVAPCCNNHLILGRLEGSRNLNERLDYVFSYGMAPHKVVLRLLKKEGISSNYILVKVMEGETINWATDRGAL